MKREEIFDQNRGEREIYKSANYEDDIPLPLTADGFEAMIERVGKDHNYPIDDSARLVVAGYVHHIPNEQDTISLKILKKVLHKSISNTNTWRIDQDIKQKRIEAAKIEAEKLREIEVEKLKEQGNILNFPPRPTPSEPA